MDVVSGSFHAIVGENGAGKSTLMRILNGSVRADSGTVRVFGREWTPQSPREATQLGVGTLRRNRSNPLHHQPVDHRSQRIDRLHRDEARSRRALDEGRPRGVAGQVSAYLQ